MSRAVVTALVLLATVFSQSSLAQTTPTFAGGKNYLDLRLSSSNPMALVGQSQCYVIEYQSGGMLKKRMLQTLPLLPWGTNALRACLPPDIQGPYSIKNMSGSTVATYNAGSSAASEQQCNGLVNYVFDGRESLLIGGSFSSSPLKIQYQGVTQAFSGTAEITDPHALGRKGDSGTVTYRDLIETNSSIEPGLAPGIGSKETLSLFLKPGGLPKNYTALVTQANKSMTLAGVNWNCPRPERADRDINLWLETPISVINSDGKEARAPSGLFDLEFLSTPKVQNDMQQLWNTGLRTITLTPRLSYTSTCSQMVKDYQSTVQKLNSNGRAFRFVITTGFFPKENSPVLFRSYDSPANMAWATQVSAESVKSSCDDQNSVWLGPDSPKYESCLATQANKGTYYVEAGIAYMWKTDLSTVRDQYACLLNSLKGTPYQSSVAGVMPWQEPSSYKYTWAFQNNLLDTFRSIFANWSGAKVYGFDGWVMSTDSVTIADPLASPSSYSSAAYLHDYVNPNFGDVLMHQSYPGQGSAVLANGSSAIQGVVDGIRFQMRSLKRNGRTAPVQISAYLQAFGKGDASTLNCPSDNMSFSRMGHKGYWSTWTEYEAQVAATEFYSYKYSLPASVAGVSFYYYGNYRANNPNAAALGYSTPTTGITHPIASPVLRPNGPTECWPRLENSPLIFGEVIQVIKDLKSQL